MSIIFMRGKLVGVIVVVRRILLSAGVLDHLYFRSRLQLEGR